MTRRPTGLYVLTDAVLRTHADLLARASAALDGGAQTLQYRDKTHDRKRRLTEARALRDCCRRAGAVFIVNDDIELAEQVGADGVHLGEHDVDVAAARARLGPSVCIGASCYGDLERARRMVTAGADYLAFGAVRASATKPGARILPPGRLIEARREFALPLVAIGGIDVDNLAEVMAAGVDAVAVTHAVFAAADPATAARDLVTAMQAAG